MVFHEHEGKKTHSVQKKCPLSTGMHEAITSINEITPCSVGSSKTHILGLRRSGGLVYADYDGGSYPIAETQGVIIRESNLNLQYGKNYNLLRLGHCHRCMELDKEHRFLKGIVRSLSTIISCDLGSCFAHALMKLSPKNQGEKKCWTWK